MNRAINGCLMSEDELRKGKNYLTTLNDQFPV